MTKTMGRTVAKMVMSLCSNTRGRSILFIKIRMTISLQNWWVMNLNSNQGIISIYRELEIIKIYRWSKRSTKCFILKKKMARTPPWSHQYQLINWGKGTWTKIQADKPMKWRTFKNDLAHGVDRIYACFSTPCKFILSLYIEIALLLCVDL